MLLLTGCFFALRDCSGLCLSSDNMHSSTSDVHMLAGVCWAEKVRIPTLLKKRLRLVKACLGERELIPQPVVWLRLAQPPTICPNRNTSKLTWTIKR